MSESPTLSPTLCTSSVLSYRPAPPTTRSVYRSRTLPPPPSQPLRLADIPGDHLTHIHGFLPCRAQFQLLYTCRGLLGLLWIEPVHAPAPSELGAAQEPSAAHWNWADVWERFAALRRAGKPVVLRPLASLDLCARVWRRSSGWPPLSGLAQPAVAAGSLVSSLLRATSADFRDVSAGAGGPIRHLRALLPRVRSLVLRDVPAALLQNAIRGLLCDRMRMCRAVELVGSHCVAAAIELLPDRIERLSVHCLLSRWPSFPAALVSLAAAGAAGALIASAAGVLPPSLRELRVTGPVGVRGPWKRLPAGFLPAGLVILHWKALFLELLPKAPQLPQAPRVQTFQAPNASAPQELAILPRSLREIYLADLRPLASPLDDEIWPAGLVVLELDEHRGAPPGQLPARLHSLRLGSASCAELLLTEPAPSWPRGPLLPHGLESLSLRYGLSFPASPPPARRPGVRNWPSSLRTLVLGDAATGPVPGANPQPGDLPEGLTRLVMPPLMTARLLPDVLPSSLTELQLGDEYTATLPALLPVCLRRLVLGRYYYATLHPSIVRSAPSLREVVAYRAFAGANILFVREWPAYVRLEMRDGF